MSESKPEPCPFCGGECLTLNAVGRMWRVCCERDITCLYSSGTFATKAEAIAAHNRVCRAVETAAKQAVTDCNHLGNAAKMREALLETKSVIAKCMDILNKIPDGCEYDGLIDEVADELCDLRESHVNAALSAPARNCDVGTAEEQLKRFIAFCLSRKCNECPFVSSTYGECGVRWSQMPYEEGGAK